MSSRRSSTPTSTPCPPRAMHVPRWGHTLVTWASTPPRSCEPSTSSLPNMRLVSRAMPVRMNASSRSLRATRHVKTSDGATLGPISAPVTARTPGSLRPAGHKAPPRLCARPQGPLHQRLVLNGEQTAATRIAVPPHLPVQVRRPLVAMRPPQAETDSLVAPASSPNPAAMPISGCDRIRRGRAPMVPLAGARVRALPQLAHIRVSVQAPAHVRLPSRSKLTAGMREAAAAGREDATKRRMPRSKVFRKCSRASSRPSWPTGASCSFLWVSLPSCSLW